MIEFVMEGNDGAGKSTTLAGVCTELTKRGITYEVHAPFHIARPLVPEGDLYSYWGSGRAEQAIDLLSNIIHRVRSNAKSQVLLFDRHWMTVFSEIEGTNLTSKWNDFPPTFYLEAPPQVTKSHKLFSHEVPFTTSDAQIQSYYDKYRNLAEKYQAHIAKRYFVASKQQDLTPIMQDITKIILERL